MSPKERERLEQERVTIQKEIDDMNLEVLDIKKLKSLLRDRETVDFRLSLG